jgi:hypothetical protein
VLSVKHFFTFIIESDIVIWHTGFTDNTTYTMVNVRSLWQIWWWMHTHVLLLTLLTPCCMSEHYVKFNEVQHCIVSVISKDVCTFINKIWRSGLTYTIAYVALTGANECTFLIKSEIVFWHTTLCKQCSQYHYVRFNDECTHIC